MSTQTLTAKQDGFCQSMVDGLSQTEAYRANYNASGMLPETVNNNAYRLAQRDDIGTRITELKAAVDAQITDKRVWDKSRFIDEAQINLTLARGLEQIAPANSALSLIGKATGILVDQPVTTDTALDAILKIAGAMSEQALRIQAGQLPASEGVVIEGEATVIEDSEHETL